MTTAKKIYCFQHVPFEGPGVFEPALRRSGFDLECILVPENGVPADLPDALLVMGGPMSVNDPDAWIQQEIRYIRNAVEKGIPYLGICLGSQFLAKALGGRVYKGPCAEIGMTDIHTMAEACSDPAFRNFPAALKVFEWHGEGIEAPPKAVVLAASSGFPVQAFRYGRSAYGLLFHLELGQDGIETLCRNCPEDLARASLDSTRALNESLPHLPLLHKLAGEVVRHVVTPSVS